MFLHFLYLVGPLFIDQAIPKDMESVEKELSVEFGGTVLKGGAWTPSCKPVHKVCVFKENESFIFLHKCFVFC